MTTLFDQARSQFKVEHLAFRLSLCLSHAYGQISLLTFMIFSMRVPYSSAERWCLWLSSIVTFDPYVIKMVTARFSQFKVIFKANLWLNHKSYWKLIGFGGVNDSNMVNLKKDLQIQLQWDLYMFVRSLLINLEFVKKFLKSLAIIQNWLPYQKICIFAAVLNVVGREVLKWHRKIMDWLCKFSLPAVNNNPIIQ